LRGKRALGIITGKVFFMADLSKRIANLTPEQRRLLEQRLKTEGLNLAKNFQELQNTSYQPIQPAPPCEYYPVAPAQKRLFILNQIESANTSYNLPGAVIIEGELDRPRLESAFQSLVGRHDILRTSFQMVDGEITQQIHPGVQFQVTMVTAREAEVPEIIREFIRPFELHQAPLLRVELIRLHPEKHILIFDIHHIIADGVSRDIMVREFIGLYEGRELPPLRLQYRDYAVWQNESLQNGAAKSQEDYWTACFSGEIPVLNFPTDYPRPAQQSFEGDSLEWVIGAELTGQINQLANRTGATGYMVLLAACNILLSKYSGQQDIIIGTPVAGRFHSDLQQIIGMFVNMLALRNYPAGTRTFREFLGQVRENTLSAFENQNYQFEELVEKLELKRDISRNPLFDVMFSYENMNNYLGQSGKLAFSPYPVENKTAKFDFSITAFEVQGQIHLHFEYCVKLFRAETIRRLARHFQNILQAVCWNPDLKISGIDMMAVAEKRQILLDFNNTTATYPKEKTIYQLFEEQVARTPDNIAVIFEDQQLSYGELNEKSNQLAGVLRKKGVGRDSIVGIMVNRSLEMILGLMGILKAGGAYLPIDPGYPAERIRYILEDSATPILLTQKAGALVLFAGETLNLEDPVLYQGETANPSKVNSSNDLAYVIYTSGSTGKPKGTMIEHYSVVNRIHWMQKQYPITKDDAILQKTPYTFDVSVWELFWWSMVGARLCLLIPGGEKDPQAIITAVTKHQITTMHFVPSMLNIFLEYLEVNGDTSGLASLRRVFASGEALSPQQTQRFNELLYSKHRTKLHNLYGPTEATVDVSYFDCSTGQNPEIVPIGKPIDNIQLYIVNPDYQIQPIGVPGELCIAGDGLARGYLNKPGLTTEKFVPNPFVSRVHIADSGLNPPHEEDFHRPSEIPAQQSKLYKTGDLARWLPDGDIEYLGRIDQQVKIRGFRIELGEIESQLLKEPSVKEAVVVTRDDPRGEKYLCAYLVAEREWKIPELRAMLGKELPDYMIPAYFIILDRMPLSPNGKVDRKNLPEPEGSISTGVEYVAPETGLELMISAIWKEVLNLDRIGMDDNFFEAGGNSLRLIKVSSLLGQKLGKPIATVDLFQYPTIRSLAGYLRPNQAGESPESALSLPAGVGKNLSDSGREQSGLDVAVIGMAGRFPGAENIAAFWRNLSQGVESISFFSDAELAEAGIDPEIINRPDYVKAKGIIGNVEYFDAAFFGYSPSDARMLDPQVRVFFECVWEALEDAGYNPYQYQGRIGLYAGASPNYYWEMLGLFDTRDVSGPFARTLLLDKRFLTTRISYQLNLKGPSVFVTTACSTSLVAIESACQALRTGTCQIALAGGVSIALPHKNGYVYQEDMIMSPDGHCRAFDFAAKGTVGGEGAGVVVLKPLASALADGDHIYAVIKGVAVNNDGRRKVGYTAPSVEGQTEVIRLAQQMGRVEPESIGYIETHGTGTTLGDPIEIEALKQAFHTRKKQFCAIGSVKTNIGHLDDAAGIAGFIKTALALHHRQIPPSLHFETPNPRIDFENSPFMVNIRLTNWQNDSYPLRAGVSSFGIGGTNAHVVLEEAPAPEAGSPSRQWHLLLISARTQTALTRSTVGLAGYFENNRVANIADVAYTLAVGREHFACRRMVVSTDPVNVVELLLREAEETQAPEDSPAVAMVFPGQGSWYPNMGRELYETESYFRDEMDRCAILLKQAMNIDLLGLFYPENEADESIHNPALDQPLIFSFEYALAKLFMKWGLKPHSMIGQDIGEYVAACLAGVLSLEDALTLTSWRGQLLREEAMAAAGKDAADSPAFQAALSEPVLARFLEKVKQTKLSAPQIPYLSNVTGDWITAAEATNPEYWIRQLRNTVKFSDGLDKLLGSGRKILIQVGGGQTLTDLIRQQPGFHPAEYLLINAVRLPQENISDQYHLLTLLGTLWCHGARIQWVEFYKDQRRRRVSLPTYPFERQRFWIDEVPLKQLRSMPEPETLTKKAMLEWFYLPSWERIPPAVPENPVLADNGRKRCLVFLNNQRFSVSFTARLQKAGFCPVLVRPGSKFSKSTPEQYTIQPQNETDYQELLRELATNGEFPTKIIHLWSITGNPDASDHPSKSGSHMGLMDPAEQFLDQGFYSLLYLARAIGKVKINEPLQMTVFTDQTQAVTGDEPLIAGKAMMIGPCKVIPQEYPYISCKFIDLELPEPDSIRENKLMSDLVNECLASAVEPVVAYRGSRRWGQIFKPIRRESPDIQEAMVNRPASRLRQQGTYLITGGLGKIGMLLARNLAETVKANLALIGHSAFPARTDWEQWLVSHDSSDLTSRRINQLKEIEALGVRVLVFTSDLSSPEQLEAIVRQAEDRFGTIHGVIHAAAAIGVKTMADMAKSDCETFFLAKVRGLLSLYQVFQSRELDFGICMSSLASILGGIGFVAYAAANSFMDAFAQQASFAGKTTWLSINWDGWRLNPDEIPPGLAGMETDQLIINPDEGIKAFHKALDMADIYQVAVSTGDLGARIDKWVKLESLKQAANSEVKTALYQRPELSNPYMEPQTTMEKKLVKVWQELLGFEQIGAGDSFFDLGGDSLKAIGLASRLHKELQVEVPIRQIFETPTIRNLAEYLERETSSLFSAIQPVAYREYYPMSAAQKRIYILSQMEPGALSYNQPGAMVIAGDLDQNRLVEAFSKVIARHESLRTSFAMVNGDPVQKIWPTADLVISWQEAPEEEVAAMVDGFIRPFDLNQAPLLRVEVIRMGATRHLLLYDMHHIISDGTSMGLLVQECMLLYEGKTLPELRIQYKDYAVWQDEQQKSGKIKPQEEYWLQRFAGKIPVLNLPTDFPRPAVRSFEGDRFPFETSAELADAVNRLAATANATLYMVFLAAFNILLSKYSGQEDICIGSPIAGRSHADLESVIGMFVNTLVMRNQPEGYKNFFGFLLEVKENALQAYQNQDYQFDELVDKLDLPRNPSRNPLFDTLFVLQAVDIRIEPVPELKFFEYPLRNETAKFDILLQGWEEGDRLKFYFEYSTGLYRRETMQRMAKDYVSILETITARPFMALNEIKLEGQHSGLDRVIKEEVTFDF
jgi:polyketide synthase PksJ